MADISANFRAGWRSVTRPTARPFGNFVASCTTTGYNSSVSGDRASECDGDVRIAMTEDARREHKQKDPDLEIAAAEWLFHDESGAKPKQAPASNLAPDSAINEVFDLAESQSS